MKTKEIAISMLVTVVFTLVAATSAFAQPPTEFTYQGRLLFNGAAANGLHDFEFRLFADPDGTTQVGTVRQLTAVNVNNGVFSVRLDFGNEFPGANRYLEIRVKAVGDEFYIILNPRQAITSAPYAIKSLNAENATIAGMAADAQSLGGRGPDQYVLTIDPRMTDARDPRPGSGSYIQNQNGAPQSQSNFNISGNGTAGGMLSANVINSATQFNLGGIRVLARPGSSNLFAGEDAGTNNTGFNNSFFGAGAGGIGAASGASNSFFGALSGRSIQTGQLNSFFGARAGQSTTAGSSNAFFGMQSGQENTTGSSNAFFGHQAGAANVDGFNNVVIGQAAGTQSTNGTGLTLVGTLSQAPSGLTNATALGYKAIVNVANAIVLGSVNGLNGATADTNVGIGTVSPAARLHIAVGASQLRIGTNGCGGIGVGFNASLGTCGNYALTGNASDTMLNRPLGGSITFRENNTTQMTISPGGSITIPGNLTVNGSLTAAIPTNSGGYVQNRTTQQAATNFNISGNGTVGGSMSASIFNAATAYQLNGDPVLSADEGAQQLFVGIEAGLSNTTGLDNTFVGDSAGQFNSTGSRNTHVGRDAGRANVSGNDNTTLGYSASAASGLNFATAIGSGANVMTSNTIQLGRSNGFEAVLVPGTLTVRTLGGGGMPSLNLCLNGVFVVAACPLNTSSIRYKTNVEDYRSGLSIVDRLRPVSFDWKKDGAHDFGLIAEEVAEIEPDLALRNEKGEIDGVKYDRVSVILINAVKELQALIHAQKKALEEQARVVARQQAEIKSLRRAVCADRVGTNLCPREQR